MPGFRARTAALPVRRPANQPESVAPRDLQGLRVADTGVGFDRTKAQGVGTVAEFTLDPAPAAG